MDVSAVAVAGRGLVDPGEPVFAADDEALLRGRSVFETTRVYGGRPFRLDEHLARFAVSAERLRLPPPDADECRRLAELVIEASGVTDLAVRLYWSGGTLVATPGPMAPRLVAPHAERSSSIPRRPEASTRARRCGVGASDRGADSSSIRRARWRRRTGSRS